MNLDIDLGFKAAVAARSECAALLDPAEDPPDKRIHSGTSPEFTATKDSYLIIECGELDHRAGSLYLADVQFSLYSSAISEDPACETVHRALSTALFDFLKARAEIAAAFQSTAVELLPKPFLNRPSQQQGDKRWVWEATLSCGFLAL